MTPAMTQLVIAHQDATSLIAVAPPYSALAGLFLGGGLACWLLGIVLSIAMRGRMLGEGRHPVAFAFPLLLCAIIGAPLVYTGFLTGRATRVTLSATQKEMKVERTLMTVPISRRTFPMDQVRHVLVGVGFGCTSLQVAMSDGRGETIIGCTDRTGYNQVADAINRFLDVRRQAQPQPR